MSEYPTNIQGIEFTVVTRAPRRRFAISSIRYKDEGVVRMETAVFSGASADRGLLLWFQTVNSRPALRQQHWATVLAVKSGINLSLCTSDADLSTCACGARTELHVSADHPKATREKNSPKVLAS